MKTLELMKARHSVRHFIDRPLDAETIDALQAEIDACNAESGMHIQLITDEPEAFHNALPDIRMLAVSGFDWNEKLSPWPAQRVFRNGDDFGGKADELIGELLEALKQYPGRKYIAGYSLAGLFALYTATKTDQFEGCASVSGSLWYPDFEDYIQTHPVLCSSVYLSLGDLEKNSRNPLMKTVEEKTERISRLLAQYTNTVFEMNPGNHFHEPEKRMAKAVRGLLQMQQK